MIISDPFSSQMPFGNGIFSGHNRGCHGVTACFHRKLNSAVTTQDVLFYWQKADAPLTEEFLLTFFRDTQNNCRLNFFWAFKGVEEWSKNTLHVFSESISVDMALLIHFQREARTCFSYSRKQTCSVFLQDLVKTNSLNLSIICKQLLPAHLVLDTLLNTSR